MKIGYSFILSLLFFAQSVLIAQSTNLFQDEDGEDTPLGAVVCRIVPCFDESLGWRNIFGPIAADPVDAELEPVTIPAEDVPRLREQLASLTGDLLQIINSNRQEEGREGGGTRRHRRAVRGVEKDLTKK